MAICYEKVDPAVIIIVKEFGPPSDIGPDCSHFGCVRDISEGVVAVIVVESIVFVGKVGLEQIKQTVVVIVANSHAHATLLAAALVERCARSEAYLFKRTVPVIVVKKTGSRVVGDIDVNKTVFI